MSPMLESSSLLRGLPFVLPILAGCVFYLLLSTWGQKNARRRGAMNPIQHSYLARRLPPGPRGLPFVQNLFDMPSEKPWVTAVEWAKIYGDVVHVSAIGQHIVYLNSHDTAVDLLEKRSSLYSDRFHSSMLELMGVQQILALMKYGLDWRLGRRIFHQEFNLNTTSQFKERQTKYALGLLALLWKDPDSFEKHFKYFSSGIILETVYGFEINPVNDPHVKAAENAVDGVVSGLVPGVYLVDVFPIMKSIPSWFPGAQFKRNARKWGAAMMACCSVPIEEVSEAFEAGTAAPSFVASWLSRINNSHEKLENNDHLRRMLEVTAGTAFLAGYETTSSTLLNFVLHMVQHPEVQCKAHEELDRVIGRDRLPGFEDKDSLPYLNAIYKETLRWHPVLPFGIPHTVVEDDEYKGMHIPKGSLIAPNAWAMSRNDKDYGPDPEAFRPERYLESDARDPSTYVFGFGRRICPGRFMAENSLFIAMCCTLQVFSISKALNDDGSEKPLKPHWVDGITSHLEPFTASIKPRFEGAERLIEFHKSDFGDNKTGTT